MSATPLKTEQEVFFFLVRFLRLLNKHQVNSHSCPYFWCYQIQRNTEMIVYLNLAKQWQKLRLYIYSL